ncbi:MAG: dTDP-4-dehydrorhamnose reductase [Chitinophagaceae bacterium]|nr:dTDP-4-dehydrorhamnose reductase [Chitinophagaceae bacterium]
MKRIPPAFFINCAAYTAVDKAESERELAFQVNAEAVGTIASLCEKYKCRLIHISTDYVFDGKGASPYLPDSPTGPQSVYGASKLAGEQKARAANPDCIIIRTSWVYSEFGKNFVKTMLRLMGEKPEIGVVEDQWGSPTYAADLAEAIMKIIAGDNWVPGIYHFSNTGAITWHQFASTIRDLGGYNTVVNPIPSSAYPVPATRPSYSVMDTESIAKTFDITLKPWQESLAVCLDRLKKLCKSHEKGIDIVKNFAHLCAIFINSYPSSEFPH